MDHMQTQEFLVQDKSNMGTFCICQKIEVKQGKHVHMSKIEVKEKKHVRRY